jgi:hypothetical protein
MGLLDKAKALLGQHEEKVEDAIDKVADVVDDKTGGKYADKIDKGAEAAKNLVGDDDDAAGDGAAGDGAAPEAAPEPTSDTP